MQRCIHLALLARNQVAPNPMVGAVLVYQDRIIGEGYHQQYGQAHAEVACIASVKKDDEHLVAHATLYVSLEPCAHWGKTPPCTELIIQKKIPSVIIGCRDPFPEVDGKGIEKLKAARVAVNVGVLEAECKELNKRFFMFHQRQRPYAILKWAQTADNRIGKAGERLKISSAYTDRLVHKWRSEEAAILIGTTTALADNPQLNTRHWPGKNPVRLVIDKNLRLPPSLHLFNGETPTIVFNFHKHTLSNDKLKSGNFEGTHYYQVQADVSLLPQLLTALYLLGIQSILVEGGAQLLQSFTNEGVWDEARVITAEGMLAGNGIAAPVLHRQQLVQRQSIATDSICFYRPL